MTDEEKKERARINSRKYYQTHKEEILAKQYVYKKKKYKEDPEYRKKVYENSRRWIEKNPEKAYAIKRKWQVEHREPTKDEIIARLQEEIMWLKDEIQDKKDYIAVIEENNQNMQEEMCRTWKRVKKDRETLEQQAQRLMRCINYLRYEMESIIRIAEAGNKKEYKWIINRLQEHIKEIKILKGEE